jgi:DNA-binding MarR family transcriptional regulator
MSVKRGTKSSRRTPELLDASLGFNVYRCALLLRRELTRALARYHMTPEQWHVLAVLDEADAPVSQAEIVEVLLKDKPTVTRILQRMERDEWIRRSTDAADARVVRVQMTPSGSRLCRKIPGLLTAHLAGFFKAFTSAELNRMISDLKRVRRQLGD